MAFDNVMSQIDSNIEGMQKEQELDQERLSKAIDAIEELKLRMDTRQTKLDEYAAARRLLDGAYDKQ